MTTIVSGVDLGSDEFLANVAAMEQHLSAYEAMVVEALAGGGERYTDRHLARRKMLVRQRVELLVDADSPFLELSPIAGADTEYSVVLPSLPASASSRVSSV
jgi:acetyl-CoA carboxylase carboxyltransferase component